MPPTASFTYRALSGAPLYQACRFDHADGSKSFSLQRADGTGGWTGGQGAMTNVGRVVYRWAELRGHATALNAEGEGCVDALWSIGVPATTNVGGAGNWCSGPYHEGHDYAAQLKMVGVENVVVLPDNDDPGRRHAEDVATACHAAGLRVKVVDLPDLEPKGDVVDYLRDHSKDDLFALVTAASEWTPQTTDADPVTDGAAMMDALVAFIRRYVALSNHQANELALFVVHTHAFEAAESTPYQNIGSATKQSGKTRLLEVLELLVATPWLTGRATTAVLARRIEKERPTLLLDETDAAFKAESEYAESLRAILNSGYRHTGKASVCLAGGSSYVDLATFCPKAIAGIGTLPDTVADRSVPIWLQRRRPSDRIERLRARDARQQVKPLRAALQAWATGNKDDLRSARPTIPTTLGDRAADVCEPLLAIADAIGGPWPDRARQAVVALCTGREDEQSRGTQLLTDIRTVFDRTTATEMFSDTIIEELIKKEESPWGEYKQGKPLTKTGLARLLKPYGVRPTGTIRVGDRTGKGYRRTAFDDAFSRYLPPQPSQRHKSNNDGDESPISTRHIPVTQPSHATADEKCDGVTVADPSHGLYDSANGEPGRSGGEPCDGVTDEQPSLGFDDQPHPEAGGTDDDDVEEF